MAVIEQLIKNLEAVDMNDVIEESVEATRDDLARLQKLQLLSGEKSDDTKIGKYRNKNYAAKKYAQNPLAGLGNVDLRLTGDFYSGIIIDPRDRAVIIDSDDPKTDALTKKYGKNIFGLNTEFGAEYGKEHMGPVATGKIKKQIHT